MQAKGPNPEKGAAKRVGVRRVGGPEGWGAQNFVLFFPLAVS